MDTPVVDTQVVEVEVRPHLEGQTGRRVGTDTDMSTMRISVWLAIGVLCTADASAAPRDPRVVWAGGSSVVVAARDSIVASPGDSVHFAWKGRPIAAGTVATLVDHVVAVVRLDHGSLGSRTLDRIEVRIVRGPRLTTVRLRVGQPASARRGARCAALAPRDATYAVRAPNGATDVLTARSASASGAWPDTLEVRFFDDPVDEEIAIQRGEIDVAVFGPGELSPSMRRETRASDVAWATVADAGVIAAWTRDASAPPAGPWLTVADQRAFDALARGHFQGDVIAHDAMRAAGAQSAARPTRYEADPSCPDARGIAAALPRVDAARARVVRLGWLDVAADAPDSALAAAVTRLDPGAGVPRVAVLFTPRFAVVAAPVRRGDVAAIGADGLAGLYRCAPEAGR